MKKYSWIKTELADRFKYSVLHEENGTTTIIAITDSAEKAQFIMTACNEFDYDKYEAKKKLGL